MQRDARVGQGIADGHVDEVALHGVDDVDHPRVAHIGTVLLEGEAQYQQLGAEHLDAFLQHQLHHLIGHVAAHGVVHTSSRQDDLGVVAVALCCLRQVEGVHADAVAAHQPGLEGEEVPLRPRCLEHILRVDAHLVEYLRQLVHEGDVDIPLRIFDHLRCLGHPDGGCQVRARLYHRGIDCIDQRSCFGRTAGGDLPDLLYRMFLVAGVDALGTVSGEEIDVVLQPTHLLHHRQALLLRHPGVDGGFIHHDIAGGNHLAHRLAGTIEGAQVGVVVAVDRGGHRHHVEVTAADGFKIGGAGESALEGGLQQRILHLEGGIMTAHQLVHARLVQIEPHGGVSGTEKTCQGKSYIPQPNYGYSDLLVHRYHFF